jgi:hypothetical protein
MEESRNIEESHSLDESRSSDESHSSDESRSSDDSRSLDERMNNEYTKIMYVEFISGDAEDLMLKIF